MSTRYCQQTGPSIAPRAAISASVIFPPVASDSKSLSSKSCLPSSFTSDNTAHNQGPSIFGPPFGNPGFSYQMSFICSRNPSKGEKSDTSFLLISSHFRLVNAANGDTSKMLLRAKFNRSKLIRFSKNERSEIPQSGNHSSFTVFNAANGDTSTSPSASISIFISFGKFVSGDKSGTGSLSLQ